MHHGDGRRTLPECVTPSSRCGPCGSRRGRPDNTVCLQPEQPIHPAAPAVPFPRAGELMTLRSRLLLAAAALTVAGSTGRADDWPQWMGPNRDAVWTETGILDTFPAGGPKELWRVAIGGGYAGPAVAGGKVYVADKKLKDGAKDPANAFDTSKTESS